MQVWEARNSHYGRVLSFRHTRALSHEVLRLSQTPIPRIASDFVTESAAAEPYPLYSGYRFFCFLTACGSFSPPFVLISARASLVLNGYLRTDCWPVVLRVTSTRRLFARTMTAKLSSVFLRSSGLRSGSSCNCSLTWSADSSSSLPNARTSMLPAGTPCSTRKLLARSTRRSESALL